MDLIDLYNSQIARANSAVNKRKNFDLKSALFNSTGLINGLGYEGAMEVPLTAMRSALYDPRTEGLLDELGKISKESDGKIFEYFMLADDISTDVGQKIEKDVVAIKKDERPIFGRDVNILSTFDRLNTVDFMLQETAGQLAFSEAEFKLIKKWHQLGYFSHGDLVQMLMDENRVNMKNARRAFKTGFAIEDEARKDLRRKFISPYTINTKEQMIVKAFERAHATPVYSLNSGSSSKSLHKMEAKYREDFESKMLQYHKY